MGRLWADDRQAGRRIQTFSQQVYIRGQSLSYHVSASGPQQLLEVGGARLVSGQGHIHLVKVTRGSRVVRLYGETISDALTSISVISCSSLRFGMAMVPDTLSISSVFSVPADVTIVLIHASTAP